MIIRCGFAPRAVGLTPEAAQEHWRGTHGGMAARLPGLRRYVQHHAVLRDGRPLLPHPGFDIFAETEFDSLDAMAEAFASTLYQGQIADDEVRLIQRERFSLAVTERHVIVDGDPGADAVKLVTLHRAHPARGRAALVDALLQARVDALRHEILVALRPEDAFDASEETWFPDAAAALAFVNSAAGDAVAEPIAGLVLGRERLIARPVLIAGPRLP